MMVKYISQMLMIITKTGEKDKKLKKGEGYFPLNGGFRGIE